MVSDVAEGWQRDGKADAGAAFGGGFDGAGAGDGGEAFAHVAEAVSGLSGLGIEFGDSASIVLDIELDRIGKQGESDQDG